MNSRFHGKTQDSKLTPFLQIPGGEYQNNPFLGKCESWISFIH